MKYIAQWNDQVVAEADESAILEIEGNIYFPVESIIEKFFKPSDYHTTCPWKGLASYYDLIVGGKVNENSAWYYSEPKAGSPEVVAKDNNGRGDFKNYVAFWNGVQVLKV